MHSMVTTLSTVRTGCWGLWRALVLPAWWGENPRVCAHLRGPSSGVRQACDQGVWSWVPALSTGVRPSSTVEAVHTTS